MKLKSLNRYISLLIIIFFLLPVSAEEEIDIWNKKIQKNSEEKLPDNSILNNTINSEAFSSSVENNSILVDNKIFNTNQDVKIFGIYDPAENNFNLNMWSSSQADNIRSSIERINKITLSNTSKKIFENTLFSFAYPPQGMDEKEFIDLKIDWLVNNKLVGLIEKFLKQNPTFHNKDKVIQYLVDQNISKANIKESCDKINFIDKSIKNSYLEKFKIYCLVFENKKNEAQLL